MEKSQNVQTNSEMVVSDIVMVCELVFSSDIHLKDECQLPINLFLLHYDVLVHLSSQSSLTERLTRLKQ